VLDQPYRLGGPSHLLITQYATAAIIMIIIMPTIIGAI